MLNTKPLPGRHIDTHIPDHCLLQAMGNSLKLGWVLAIS
jgi:hypothetical protein